MGVLRLALLAVVVSGLLGLPSAPAEAAPITYELNGALTFASPPLEALGFEVGDPLSATFTLDPAEAVDLNPDVNTGFYVFEDTPLTVAVEGAIFGSTFLDVIISNDAATVPPVDSISMSGGGPFTSTAAGFNVIGMIVSLTSSGSTAFSSDAFFVPTDLSPFDTTRSLTILFSTGGEIGVEEGETLEATITSIRPVVPTAIPEPASVSLLLLGAAGAFALKRRAQL